MFTANQWNRLIAMGRCKGAVWRMWEMGTLGVSFVHERLLFICFIHITTKYETLRLTLGIFRSVPTLRAGLSAQEWHCECAITLRDTCEPF